VDASCDGGGCTFVGCVRPRCRGGGCDFRATRDVLLGSDRFCEGGGCSFEGHAVPSDIGLGGPAV
jgi:hypothetical protein